jgi:hypothetical protein
MGILYYQSLQNLAGCYMKRAQLSCIHEKHSVWPKQYKFDWACSRTECWEYLDERERERERNRWMAKFVCVRLHNVSSSPNSYGSNWKQAVHIALTRKWQLHLVWRSDRKKQQARSRFRRNDNIRVHLNALFVNVLTGFSWINSWTFPFHERQNICWVADSLSAFEDGACSIQLVYWLKVKLSLCLTN